MSKSTTTQERVVTELIQKLTLEAYLAIGQLHLALQELDKADGRGNIGVERLKTAAQLFHWCGDRVVDTLIPEARKDTPMMSATLKPDRELDALVAVALGRPFNRKSGIYDTCGYADEQCDGRYFFSSSMTSAMVLFEQLAEEGLVSMNNGEGDSKEVDFIPSFDSPLRPAHISGETYAHAICLAFLEANKDTI